MRKSLTIFILWFGVLMAPNHFLAQQFRSRVALQTGLFHYFFDKSPILNVNYPSNYKKPNLLKGLLINSFAINYTFYVGERSGFELEYASFRQMYSRYHKTFEENPVIGMRFYSTFMLNYIREKNLADHFSCIYGGGINYRYGSEGIILNRFEMAPGIYELTVDPILRRDIGVNVFCGMNYNFSKRFFCYSKIDFLSTLYFKDKDGQRRMKEIYHSPQFPTRFDLSLKFGIGVKF